jgi:hypothetical protein
MTQHSESSLESGIEWIEPKDCRRGEIYIVHMMWSPYPEYVYLKEIPPSPLDLVWGTWYPTSRMEGDIIDLALLQCGGRFAKASMNLFQDSPDYAIFSIHDQDYAIPWEGKLIIALLPPGVPASLP